MSKCVQFNIVFFKCQEHQSASQGIQNRLFFVVPTAAGNMASFTKEIRHQLSFPRALVVSLPSVCSLHECVSLSRHPQWKKKPERFLLFFYYSWKEKGLNLKVIFTDYSKDSSYLSIIIALECSNCFSLLLNLTLALIQNLIS